MTGSLQAISTAWPGPMGPVGPVGSLGFLTAVTGPPSTTQAPTTVPGAHQDAADFYGLFGAIAIILGAIFVIRLAFRRPKPPGPPQSGPSPPGPSSPSGDLT